MPSGEEDRISKIEELKRKLSGRTYRPRLPHPESFPHFHPKEVSDTWTEPEASSRTGAKLMMQTSFFKKFFVFSGIFFCLALGYAFYTFFADSNTVSNENIEILVKGEAYVPAGEEYLLSIGVVNRNTSPLELADLVLEYPRGSQSGPGESERLRLSLSTVPSGGIKNESARITLFGSQGSVQKIKIRLEYRVAGSNAIFVKEVPHEVEISSTPVVVSIDLPNEAFSGEDVSLNFKVGHNSAKPVTGVLLEASYPVGFQFVRSTPAPSFGDNIWVLGDLSPGGERNIAVYGRLVDVFDGEEKVFRAWSGSQSPAGKFTIGTFFGSSERSLFIKKPSLTAELSVNSASGREYAINTKSSAQVQISWRNNLETKISNIEIRAKLSGNALDRRSISVGHGFYDSSKDMIIWNRSTDSRFGQVAPDEYGTVSFSFSPLPLVGSSEGILFSPVVNLDVSISGDSSSGSIGPEISNRAEAVIRVVTDVGFSTRALYYGGPFSNTGPIPPKAEEKTTYTISWSLSNTANNVSKAEVRATLPVWVRFTGRVSPGAEDVSYNSSTREIVWSVGTLRRGTGVLTPAREVYFQVELLPSLSQVGSSPILVNEASLTGTDDFANVSVRASRGPLGIALSGDPSFPPEGWRVVE